VKKEIAMKSNIFNILYLAPYERGILKRYPSISKAWNQYKWKDCIDATQEILKELSPLVQDSYQYILFRVMMYCHFMLRNFDVSYDYAIRILDLSYEMKDNIQTSRALMDIARIHKIVEDVPIAIEILKQSIQLNPNNIIALSELCLSYLEIKEFDNAECSLRRIELLYEEKEFNYPGIVIALIKIYLYIQKADYKKAENILSEIEKEFYNPDLSLVSPLYFLLKGLTQINNKMPEESIKSLNQSVELSKTYYRKNILINSLKLRSQAQAELKHYKEAYEDRIFYNQLSNELNNILFNQRLAILKKYYYRKQNEIKNQQIIEKAVRLTTVSLMADNMIYEITPHLHSIHLNIDTILFWHKRHPGILPGLFLEEVKMIRESVVRTETIIKQMKNFWTLNNENPSEEWVEVNDAVIKTEKLVVNHLEQNIHIEMNLSEQPLYIAGNPILIEQILINLLNNAIQALRKSNKAEKKVIISTELAEQKVHINVDDNAIGFYYDAYPRETDFFSSSKSDFDGMGLGLMICKNFLDRFNGSISFINNEMGGASIRMILPAKPNHNTWLLKGSN